MNRFGMFVLCIVLGILMINATMFTVYETDRALIIRLGKLVQKDEKNLVYRPGLHWKIPFIDTVLLFDSRLNMSDISADRIVTKEKKDLIVDLFLKWRISDYSLFYNSTFGSGDHKDRANELLRQRVLDILRAEFGQRTIRNVVSAERNELMERLKEKTRGGLAKLGIQLVDARIKRIDLPASVNDAVYGRMRSERERVAAEHRANGEARAEMIRAEAESQRRVILASAAKEAERIKGEGDVLAMKIYADNYGKAPEFFEFYRSLEAYKRVFKDRQDFIILGPTSDFFKYFNNGMIEKVK